MTKALSATTCSTHATTAEANAPAKPTTLFKPIETEEYEPVRKKLRKIAAEVRCWAEMIRTANPQHHFQEDMCGLCSIASIKWRATQKIFVVEPTERLGFSGWRPVAKFNDSESLVAALRQRQWRESHIILDENAQWAARKVLESQRRESARRKTKVRPKK